MRSNLLGLSLLTVCFLGCDDHDDRWGHRSESSILFGIKQTPDEASGKVTTTTGYEFLELGGKGWSQLRSAEDDECFFEDFSARRGKLLVERGAAIFSGPKLPPGGLLLNANEEGPTLEKAAFETGETLRLSISGFALPPVSTIGIAAPPTKLDIATPKEGPLTLREGDDFDVEWAALTPAGRSSVLVSFETEEPDGRGRDVACFFKNQSKTKVPGSLLSSLVTFRGQRQAGEVKGTLVIATHSQTTIHARGGWTIYAIATAVHRTQPFVFTPN